MYIYIYIYWSSSFQHTTLEKQLFESLPIHLCCKCFTFFAVHFWQFEINLAWQTYQEK